MSFCLWIIAFIFWPFCENFIDIIDIEIKLAVEIQYGKLQVDFFAAEPPLSEKQLPEFPQSVSWKFSCD